MERAEKSEMVASLNQVFKNTGTVIVAQYTGLTVADMTSLRGRMRAAGGGVRVAKNRLVKLALQGTDAVHIADTKLKVGGAGIDMLRFAALISTPENYVSSRTNFAPGILMVPSRKLTPGAFTSEGTPGFGNAEAQDSEIGFTQDEDRNRNPELRVKHRPQIRHYVHPKQPQAGQSRRSRLPDKIRQRFFLLLGYGDTRRPERPRGIAEKRAPVLGVRVQSILDDGMVGHGRTLVGSVARQLRKLGDRLVVSHG